MNFSNGFVLFLNAAYEIGTNEKAVEFSDGIMYLNQTSISLSHSFTYFGDRQQNIHSQMLNWQPQKFGYFKPDYLDRFSYHNQMFALFFAVIGLCRYHPFEHSNHIRNQGHPNRARGFRTAKAANAELYSHMKMSYGEVYVSSEKRK